MTITADLVKELRERTGAAMMDCKRALVETKGNIDEAIELMRKSGAAKADKKSSRVAAEGLIQIAISADHKHAIMLEVNCETDFVARDESFIAFAKQAADVALANKTSDVAKLAEQTISGSGETIEHARQQLVAKVGENITLRRIYSTSSDDAIGSYLHGTRIGVLITMKGGDMELRKDLAMHIAANIPMVVSPDQVPANLIEKEREIFSAQAQSSGKPADIIVKMVDGRIKKFLDEVSLVGQPFVKNPDITVAKLLAEKNATVISFVRYAVGEGIEKQVTNFAEEVMAQVRGS